MPKHAKSAFRGPKTLQKLGYCVLTQMRALFWIKLLLLLSETQFTDITSKNGLSSAETIGSACF